MGIAWRGVAAALLIFLSSYLGALLWMGPWLWLLYGYPRHFRKFMDCMGSSWFCFLVLVMERVGGVQVHVSGQVPRRRERALLLLNHRTRLDWIWIWCPLVRAHCARYLKVVLKDSLKKVPGLGWAMQSVVFVFITRSWERDRLYIKSCFRYMRIMAHPTQVLLFPEGTDFSANSKRRSDAFAHSNGLPIYDFVLHPRATGFANIVSYMRHETGLEAVYDVTVGYPDVIAQGELDLLKGNLPSQVHLLFERFEDADLPATADLDSDETELSALSDWLSVRWRAKEARLRRFYAQPVGSARSLVMPEDDACVQETSVLNSTSYMLYANGLLWSVFLVMAVYLIWSSWFVLIFVCAINAIFMYLTHQGGLDLAAINMADKSVT